MMITLSLVHCSKTGPAGPQGPTGETGVPGTPGSTGPQGPAGTANVIYSTWLTADYNFSSTSLNKTMRVIEPRCTREFNNKGGIVLFFFRFQDNVVFAMPYTDYNNQNYKYGFPVFFDTNGEVRFTISSTNATALTDAEIAGTASNPLQYKYVLIPGGIPTGRTADIDLKDYAAVKKAFNIPD